MKALHKEKMIPEYTQNDAVIRETLLKIHSLMWKQGKRSAAHMILDKAKLDQLVLHLMVAPESMLPSC